MFLPIARVTPLLLLIAACGGSPGVGSDDGSGDDDDDDGGTTGDGGANVDGGSVVPDAAPVADLTVCGDGSAQFTTIASAIAAASDGGGIEVCAGVFTEQLAVVDRSVRIHGAGADVTVIDASHAGTAVTVGNGHHLTLAGVTVRNGSTTTQGGGIRCVDARLTVQASALTANDADLAGGGLYGLRCEVEITDTRLDGNDGGASGGAAMLDQSTGSLAGGVLTGNVADEGGALYLLEGGFDVRTSQFTGNHARARGGAIYQKSDSAIDDSAFSGNHSDWTAGAIYVWQHAPTFHRDTITENDTAWEGGGMYLHQTSAVIEDSAITHNTSFDDGGGLRIFESHATLQRNLLANNKATDGDGGAFKSSHLAGLYVDNQIQDNEALGAGGGIELDNDSSVVRGGVISGNHASIGGGIHVMLWPWNGGTIEGVLVKDNRAWRGGGAYLENSFQTVTIRRATFQGNHAHQGAGIYTRGTPLRLSNSLILGNTASDVGGGFYVDPSASYPWTHECPCPPIDPPATVDFVVVYGNTADAGTGAWIGAPNLSFESSIFAGHSGTAIVVAPEATPTWRYNDTYPATFDGMSPGGSGNLASDPDFVAPGSDFHLAAGSACIDAGDPALTDADGTRADLGMYAGPSPM